MTDRFPFLVRDDDDGAHPGAWLGMCGSRDDARPEPPPLRDTRLTLLRLLLTDAKAVATELADELDPGPPRTHLTWITRWCRMAIDNTKQLTGEDDEPPFT